MIQFLGARHFIRHQRKRLPLHEVLRLGSSSGGDVLADSLIGLKAYPLKLGTPAEGRAGAVEVYGSNAVRRCCKKVDFAADIGSGSDVSGIVLITDGADTGNEDPLETASYLHNQNLPLFVVGVGSETAQDVELSKVHFISILLGQLIYHRSNGSTGSAPRGPKIDECWLGRCQNIGLKVLIGYWGHVFGHLNPSLPKC